MRILAFIFVLLSGFNLTAKPPPLAVETFEAAWKLIYETHFDTNFSGLDWKATRTKFLPRIEKATNNEEVRDIIQEMLDLLGHSHLMIIAGSPSTPKRGEDTRPRNGSPGIEIRAVDNQVVVFRLQPGGPADLAGVKPGWIIDQIDGEPAINPAVTNISPRQRTFLLWRHAADLLKGPVDEDCVLTIGSRKIAVKRARETGDLAQLGNLPVMYSRVLTNDFLTSSKKRVGYIRFNLWMIPAIAPMDRFIDAHRNADGLIFDIRGNVGGIGGMVMGTAGHLLNERASLGTMKMRDNELRFNVFPRRVDLQNRPTNTFQGKIAILTDPITLSTSELFAGGLQELKRARIFGEQTGGQALPSVSDRLPNGDLLYHAVADFTTPKGHRLEVNGVVPDEIILLRPEALRAGKDEPLEAALRWMDSPTQPRLPP